MQGWKVSNYLSANADDNCDKETLAIIYIINIIDIKTNGWVTPTEHASQHQALPLTQSHLCLPSSS